MKIAKIRAVVLTYLLLIAAPLCAREKADVLVMKNGDRLTCEVIALDAGVLYIKLDYVDGTISVQWSKVARLESNRLLIVKTQSGLVYSGTISTTEASADEKPKIQVAEASQKKVEIDSSQIVTIDRTSEKFWQRFNGDISLGLIYSKGNQSTQYNLTSTFEYPRERWGAQVALNSTLSSSAGSDASTRNELTFSSHRLLRWNNYFYSGVASFLESSEQGISLQTNLGGGIGRYIKNTNRSRISMIGGLAWQRTRYNGPNATTGTQNVAAGVIGADVKVFKFKKTSLKMTATLFPAISEPGRVYFRTNESYYVKLFSNVSWNFTFYGNWDNRPPAGLPGSDYGSSSGLSWTFGNR
jgi:hypothetical protein